MKKFLLLNCLLGILFLNNIEIYPQSQDTTKPTQYRRGIEIRVDYQTYQEKYAGKNLNEVKRSLFPLQDGTGVWTELNPKVPRVTYLGVHFTNPETGWAVGDLGAIIKTTEGGEEWTISETQTTTLLLKVHSYDEQIVIATGYDGLILRSTDEGETFVEVGSGVGSGTDLWGVKMLNDTLGFVCGLNQTLLKTTDAGITWQQVTTGLNEHYWAIDFIDEQYGMIACGGGKILKTTDGGENWAQTQAGDGSSLYAIDIIDNNHIAAAGANGKNVYSSDGGESWIQNNRLQHDELNSIKFINTETGYTIGTYGGDSWGIRKSTNRGVSWFTPETGNLSEWELELLPNGIGYSVGSNLWIYKTTNGYDNWSGLFLNANFVDVYFTGELTGYAADGRWTGGPLYKTTDGGENWFGLPNFPSNVFTSSLRCVTFTDSLTGFAGSAPCRIVKTTDAGESWYIVNRTGLTDTLGLINKIYFINPTTGWAVTTRGGILKTTDAGENWFAQLNAGISVIFSSIYFIDSINGWTANLGGRPYKTTNGGINWIQQTNLDIWESRDVFFNDYLNGFLLESNKLYKTTNGGISFSLIPEITGFSIAAKFSIYADSVIFITGYKTFRSIDSGNSWYDFDELTGVRINGLSLLGAGLGCAVGELGLVLRYYDETVPVELLSFNATIEDKKVLLNWTTATETNNLGFFIERKKENESNWIDLAFITGAGTSTNKNFYNYEDELNQFGKYKYRLKQIDYNGQYEYSYEIEVDFINKLDFYLSQNYPNPFNPVTSIKYSVKDAGNVSLIIFDVLGNKVAELVNETQSPGNYKVQFNASNYASGIYFYKLQVNDFVSIKKMILLK